MALTSSPEPLAGQIAYSHSDGVRGYVAGIIDGEGNVEVRTLQINSHRPSKGHALRIRVAANQRLPKLLQNLYAGSVGIQKLSAKKYWRWTVSSNDAALVLIEILPFLYLKRRQAELALELAQRLSGTKGRGRGQGRARLDSEEIVEREKIRMQISSLNKKGREEVKTD